jgi:hypothetical protein
MRTPSGGLRTLRIAAASLNTKAKPALASSESTTLLGAVPP